MGSGWPLLSGGAARWLELWPALGLCSLEGGRWVGADRTCARLDIDLSTSTATSSYAALETLHHGRKTTTTRRASAVAGTTTAGRSRAAAVSAQGRIPADVQRVYDAR